MFFSGGRHFTYVPYCSLNINDFSSQQLIHLYVQSKVIQKMFHVLQVKSICILNLCMSATKKLVYFMFCRSTEIPSSGFFVYVFKYWVYYQQPK